MIAGNVSYDELNDALIKVNEKYNGNITWKRRPEAVGRRYRFTLRVKDSHRKGAGRGVLFQGQRCIKGHRSIGACWHAHGDFFEALFEIQPDAFIKSSHTGEINKDSGNWEEYNKGSSMYPFYASDLCDCDEHDNLDKLFSIKEKVMQQIATE